MLLDVDTFFFYVVYSQLYFWHCAEVRKRQLLKTACYLNEGEESKGATIGFTAHFAYTLESQTCYCCW